MDSLKLFLFSLTAFLVHSTVIASDQPAVGRVLLSKGEVLVSRVGANEELYLMNGDIVYEDDSIETKERSILKIKFFKNGQMTLGPNSVVKLETFKKKKPGLIKLLKGQLRSQIDKEESAKEKLLVKTKTSAMGIRGTDFEIKYNPLRESTVLAVHSGLVAMSSFYGETDNPDVISDHLNFGKGVLEVGAGRGLRFWEGEYYAFLMEDYEAFDESRIDYDESYPKYQKIREIPKKPSNTESAMRNAEINRSGALNNGQ